LRGVVTGPPRFGTMGDIVSGCAFAVRWRSTGRGTGIDYPKADEPSA